MTCWRHTKKCVPSSFFQFCLKSTVPGLFFFVIDCFVFSLLSNCQWNANIPDQFSLVIQRMMHYYDEFSDMIGLTSFDIHEY